MPDSFFERTKWWLAGGFGAGLVLGGLVYSIRRTARDKKEKETLEKVKEFALKDIFRFRRNIVCELSTCPSIKFRVKDLRAIFDKFYSLVESQNKTLTDSKIPISKGSLGFKSLRAVFEQVYASCDFPIEERGRASYTVDRMMKAFDIDGSHSVDFTELVLYLNGMAFDTPEQRMEKTFMIMDADSSNALSYDEVKNLVDMVCPAFGKEHKERFLHQIWKLDNKHGGDGKISKSEWMEALTQLGFNAFNGPSQFDVAMLKYFGVTSLS